MSGRERRPTRGPEDPPLSGQERRSTRGPEDVPLVGPTGLPDVPDDGFDTAREGTELLRRELADLRREIETLVRQEVGRSAADPRKLDAIVQDTVRREVRREVDARTPWLLTQINWLAPVLGLAVGIALGLSAYAALTMRGAATDTTTLAAADPAATAAGADAATAANPNGAASPNAAANGTGALPVDPTARAAAYESMLTSGSPDLAPLIERLEAAGPAGDVRTSIAAWRIGRMTPAHAERLHSAFVQLSLRENGATGLVIDGQILRDPCRGTSCGALLELWQRTPSTAGWPAYGAGSAADTAAVRRVERLLVASALFGSAS